MRKQLSLEEAFWPKVDKREDAECWEWQGACRRGRAEANLPGMSHGQFRGQFAHRVSYRLATGMPIPRGKCILHRCDNPRCVNPNHLFVGTQADNLHDMSIKGRGGKSQRKLTENDARSIHTLALSGASHQRIAERYTLTRSYISNLLRGNRWCSVYEEFYGPKYSAPAAALAA